MSDEIIVQAQAATDRVVKENQEIFASIPARYHTDIHFLIRMGWYEGYGEGAQFVAEAIAPKKS